jgi:DDE family transposase
MGPIFPRGLQHPWGLPMKAIVVVLGLAVLAATPERASAWGDDGHKTVALIARHYLTPAAKKKFDAMLAADTDNLSIAPGREKNGPQAIARSRGGLTTKIHALVDALGNPVELMLTPGQDHDLTCAEPLLENADPRALLGDKAYDADPLLDTLAR